MWKVALILLLTVGLNAQIMRHHSSEAAAAAGCAGSGDLGITGKGATEATSHGGNLYQFTASGNICVNYGYIWARSGYAGSRDIKMFLFDDVSGEPENQLACSDSGLVVTDTSWVQCQFSSPYQITSGTTYWIGWAAATEGTIVWYYDAGSTNRWTVTKTNWAGCVFDENASTTDRNTSIYVSDD